MVSIFYNIFWTSKEDLQEASTTSLNNLKQEANPEV